jgi:hypothetical protein
LLENYFRHSKDERVDFQRGDEREDDAVGLPECKKKSFCYIALIVQTSFEYYERLKF